MLLDSILVHKDKIRFHTPGHAVTDSRLLYCDVTELKYSDNLLSPEGEIKTLENYLASAYRAEAAFLSTQGATLNIMQSVYAAEEPLLVVGAAHVSVYNAIRLFGKKAYHTDKLDLDDIPADVKSVLVTSPDYYGRTLDLAAISVALHAKGLTLIVDSAHGAHFAFSSKLPVSASEYGDMVTLSLHKTMPVLTGGSLLVAKKEYAERCLYARKLLHSTSPNYMTMCSIEQAVRDFSINGERYYDEVKNAVDGFKNILTTPYYTVECDDFSRLTVASPYDGQALYDALFIRGFVAEMTAENTVTFIVTPFNHGYLGLLGRCINELSGLPTYENTVFPRTAHDKPTELAYCGDWELVPLADAIGRLSHGEIGFYPPGTPLIYGGDRITAEAVRLLTMHADRSFGLENGRARVVK